MAALSPVEAARLADEVEAAAFRSMFALAPAALQEGLGLRVERVAGATLLLAPRMPTTMFNRALGLGFEAPASLGMVREVADAYAQAGVRAWWLHWNPLAQPAGFGAALEAEGWRTPNRRTWAKLLRPAAEPPVVDTPLAVAPAQGEVQRQVARIAAQAFEMPPFMADWLAALQGDAWRCFAVREGDQVVGGAWLYLEGDAGWLGVAAMAPSHRGQRGQAALIAHRIAAARDAGATWVVSETGEPTAAGEANPSLANLRRCGLETVASRLNYQPPE